MDTQVYALAIGLMLISLTGPGEGWQLFPQAIDEEIYAVCFVDEMRGWCVGSGGLILATVDGGRSWHRQRAPVDLDLFDVCFINPNVGWAVGEGGTIIRTENGGVTWVKVGAPTSRSLYAVHFIDDKTGWVAGGLGTMLQTTDGGESWIERGNVRVTITDLFFVDDRTGWAVGIGGLILHTEDGGLSWVKQESAVRSFLYGVHFVDSNEGWAVGDGVILHTVDGGRRWEVQAKGSWVLKSVYFPNPALGWAVGNGGALLKTTDGGKSWRRERVAVEDDLLDISQGGTKVWVVGGRSILMEPNVPPPERPARAEVELDESVRMPYEPIVKLCSLRVNSVPEGAEIILDDRPTGLKTPALLEELPPGRHVVKLVKTNHGHVERAVFLREGESKEIEIRLPSRSKQISIFAAGLTVAGIAAAAVYLFSGAF